MADVQQPMSLSEYVKSVKDAAIQAERWLDDYEKILTDMLNALVSSYIVRQLRFGLLIPQKGSFTADTKLRSLTACRACITLGATYNAAIKKGETAIRECTGAKKTQKGSSGLNTLAIDNLDIEGRPLFSMYTVNYLATKYQQHRRHIGAWGDMREYMSIALASMQSQGMRETFLMLLREHLERWCESVPEKVLEEFETLIKAAPNARFGDLGPDDGKVVLKVLYLANSNPNNLWVGNGPENISINSTGIQMFTKLEACITEKDLQSLIEVWEQESKEQTNPGRAKRLAVLTMKEGLKDKKIIYENFEQLMVNQRDLELAFTKEFLERLQKLKPDEQKEAFLVQSVINNTIETVIASLKIDAISQEKTYEEIILEPEYVTNAGKIFQVVYGTKQFNIEEFWGIFEYLLKYPEEFLQYCRDLK